MEILLGLVTAVLNCVYGADRLILCLSLAVAVTIVFALTDCAKLRVVHLYVLDDSLNDIVTKLKKALKKEDDVEYVPNFREEYEAMSSRLRKYTGYSIIPKYIDDVRNSARKSKRCASNHSIELLSCKDLISFIQEPPVTCPDVFIILGHSNIFNFGVFSIGDILKSFLHTKQLPSIIAFLGCCGALPRFGQLPMFSTLPKFGNTVLSFFQRRIYEDELMNTALVNGIGNYLRLSRLYPNANPKIVAMHSFAVGFVNRPDDSSTFLNIDHSIITCQKLFAVVKDSGIDTFHIPQSLMQLALYHTYIHGIYKCFEEFINDLQNGTYSIEEIDRKCKDVLQRFKIDRIFHLVTELQFRLSQVSEQTLNLLYEGKWKNVEHLQFFLAILNGYWGKNHIKVVRECAGYHLQQIMQKICTDANCIFKTEFVAFDVIQRAIHECDVDHTILHQYHLCCVAYCMFSRNHFIYFPKQEHTYKRFRICLWSEFYNDDDGYVITPKGLLSLSDPNCFMKIPRNTPELPKLPKSIPWVSHYSLCGDNNEFVELFNSQDDSAYVKIHNYRTLEPKYLYSRTDFINALLALWSCRDLFKLTQRENVSVLVNALRTMDQNVYEIKVFTNTCSAHEGHVQCFNGGLYCVEMRVTRDQIDEVSRCRFVYTYYFRYDYQLDYYVVEGDLYFTNSHYGWDLIVESELDKVLKNKHTSDVLNDMTYYGKINSINNKVELYRLLTSNSNKEGPPFPFERLGTLTLGDDFNLQ